MFNKAMTGGACQPDGSSGGLSANPLTNMIDTAIMGDAKARQAAEGYGPMGMQGANLQQQQMM
jgi:hypothetical protein